MPCYPDCIAPFDLHNHTWWSYDAAAQPDAYFRRARELSIRALALTEHHVFDSWFEVKEAARAYPDVRVIPAAEISVTTSLGAVDLLCYGIPEEPRGALKQMFERYRAWQVQNGSAISRGMKALGFSFNEFDRWRLLLSYRPAKAVLRQGPTHIKNAVLREHFIQRGFIRGAEDYAALMHQVRVKGEAAPYPEAKEIAPVLKEAGVLLAIAHPYGYFGGFDMARIEALRRECQLDGIECAHPAVPPEFTPQYRQYCVEHGLFSVGGTDNHADDEVARHLGRHLGEREWLDELLERLERR